MDIASLGIKIDTADAKTAVDNLGKLADAGKGAEGAAKRTGDAWSKASQAIQGDTGQIVTLLKQLNNTQTAALTAMNNYAQSLQKTATASTVVTSSTDAAAKAIATTATATKSAGSSIDDYIKKLETLNKSQLSASTTARLMSLSGRGATDAQLVAAKSALDLADTKRSSDAIDEQIKRLQTLSATAGMTARDSKLYQLALQGASRAQLDAAESAIRLNDAYAKGVALGEKVRRGLALIATSAATLGLAASASVLALGKSSISALADFKDLSDISGSSIENISALDRVARETGGTFDTVSTSLTKFNQVLISANGKDDASRVFKALNLDIKELKGLDPAEALRKTAVALAGFSDDANKARAVQELFGKSTKEVGPFLKDLAEKTELVGQTSERSATQADTFTKQLAALKANSSDAARSITIELLPALNRFLKNYTDIKAAGGFGLIVKDAAKDLVGLGKMTGDNGADIKSFMRERDRLQKDLDFSTRKGLPTRDIEGDLSENARYLALLRLKQRNQVEAAGLGDDYGDAVSRRFNRPVSLQVEGKPTKVGKTKDTSAQEEKKQLDADLAAIKNAGAKEADVYSDAEKILEALRSAALVDEHAYYSEKGRLLQSSSAAQQTALEQEIARLKEEDLSGKDRIENNKKIADAEAKLEKARREASTSATVLAIQEKAANDKVTQSINDARVAAEDYLKTQQRRYDRDLAGLGRGDQNRARDALTDATEDKFLAQRQALDDARRRNQITQEQYDTELAINKDAHAKALKQDDDYFKEKLAKQQSFTLGAQEALSTYYDESRNVFKQTQDAVTDTFKGMEDALVNFVKTGKLDFKSFADSVIADIARIVIKQQVTGPLAGFVNGLLSGGKDWSAGLTAAGTSDLTSITGRAIGGPVSAGGLYRVNEKGMPEVLTTGGRQYLMMGTQGGSVSQANGGTQAPVINNFTVGDVATVSMVRQGLAQTQRQSAAALQRSRAYGGAD